MKPVVSIFWFRRDLRLDDNTGLFYALKGSHPVIPIFIFDRNILDKLDEKNDRRVEFIHDAIRAMQLQLRQYSSSMLVYYGYPLDVFRQLFSQYDICAVRANHDYEPYARERDAAVEQLAHSHGATFHTYKDQVIFEKDEVIKEDGTPYTVFSPYSRKWKATLNDFYYKGYPVDQYAKNFYTQVAQPVPSLDAMGFRPVGEPFPSPIPNEETIRNYKEQRNIPGINGTTHMSVHLRFGTVSIRSLVRLAFRLSGNYLEELIWRDFFHSILWHFPRVGHGRAFKPEYDLINWRNNEEEFERWCAGNTGYPIVDAGMRELNKTGFMHNRVRMITASFLSKHLLIDWRWGEAYFAKKLLDFDLAANNGGWQWAAGSGCDAAPYFRIFNPYIQTKKFDPQLTYIRKWVPEFEDFGYAAPIVDHDAARQRCLEVYGKAVKKLTA